MASLLTHERPLAAAISLLSIRPLRLLARARADRQQRKALATLMELDDRRLEDLGLSRDDVREAMRTRPRSLGEVFAARRARAARRSLEG